MNEFSHFCIGDDPMKEVDVATSEHLNKMLKEDVDWDNKDVACIKLLAILEEMVSFDINAVDTSGEISKSEYMLSGIKREMGVES